jgi:hypothetical protein
MQARPLRKPRIDRGDPREMPATVAGYAARSQRCTNTESGNRILARHPLESRSCGGDEPASSCSTSSGLRWPPIITRTQR